jgi:hypothetical protein
MPRTDAAADLRTLVERTVMVLLALPDAEAARRPAPDRWSPKEIMGHLIDSAANNHRRFVQAQGRDDLVFDGYEQDVWVETQRYDDADWPSLVTLWWMYNKHLARVMAAVPADLRLRPAEQHNLHEIAWRPKPETEPATLDDLMWDYVDHLRHHLAQILPGLSANGRPANGSSSQKDR